MNLTLELVSLALRFQPGITDALADRLSKAFEKMNIPPEYATHMKVDKFGNVTDETKAATIAMARFSAELGVPSTITHLMLTTPPDKIAWLSAEDLRAMGTTMIGRPIQARRGSE